MYITIYAIEIFIYFENGIHTWW